MIKTLILSLLTIGFLSVAKTNAQEVADTLVYTYKTGDSGGTGKWFMGREIAGVMSYRGMGWLERDSRPDEEKTARLLANMNLNPNDVVADIGAGSGYHVFKMASMLSKGHIYAVDIQEEMLAAIKEKIQETATSNVTPVQGNLKNVNLPEHSIDKVLMVDVYHEFEYPLEMMASIKKALKDSGVVCLVEYRGEDNSVGIKKLHKMTEAQVVKEMKASGFTLVRNINNLPLQHFLVFKKE